MRKLIAVVVGCLLLTGAQARATLVYDDGTFNAGATAYAFSGGFSVTDSFTVTSTTSLSEVQAAIVAAGGTPASVDWSIGTAAYGSDISSGTGASLSSTSTGVNEFGNPSLPIFESTFAVNGTVTTGTTYWLTLSSGNPVPLFWASTSSGPSSAFQSGSGAIGAESFQLFSSNTAVPEIGASGAGSLAVILLGAMAVWGQGKSRGARASC